MWYRTDMINDTRKIEVLQVRVSPQEKTDILRKADAVGMTMSVYLRTLALRADLEVVAQLR